VASFEFGPPPPGRGGVGQALVFALM
jgi:hypothetical protein